MIDPVFLTFDGTPQTGKIPVQVATAPGTDLGKAMGLLRPHLLNFHTALQLGSLSQLRRSVELEDGGVVELNHVYGVTSAKVTLSSEERELQNFYGGILIQPRELTNPEAYDADSSEENFVLAQSELIRGSTKVPGRGSIPGTDELAPKEWLVVQISRRKPLSAGESIRTGAVRIFRANDPKHGELVEVNFKKQYLLSASGSALLPDGRVDPSKPARLAEFYFCGKRIPTLPALSAIPHSDSAVRIRTESFKAPSFEKADQARGIVIVATLRQLFVINTAVSELPTAWTVIDELPAPDPTTQYNAFGTVFTRERDREGTLLITCGGSNKAGACSGFEVRIKRGVDGAPPVITGALRLAPLRYVPPVPGSSEFRYSWTGVLSPYRAPSTVTTPAIYGVWDLTVDPPVFIEARAATWWHQVRSAETAVSFTYHYHFSEGANGQRQDPFTGDMYVTDESGTAPSRLNRRAPPREARLDWSYHSSASFVGDLVGIKGTNYCTYGGVTGIYLGVFPEPPTYLSTEDFLGNVPPLPLDVRRLVTESSVDIAWTGSLTLTNGFAGTRTLLNVGSMSGAGFTGGTAEPVRVKVPLTDPPLTQSVSTTSASSGTLDRQGSEDWIADAHIGTCQCWGTVVSPATWRLTGSTASGSGGPPTSVAYEFVSAARTFEVQLVRPDKSVIFSWGNIYDRFPVNRWTGERRESGELRYSIPRIDPMNPHTLPGFSAPEQTSSNPFADPVVFDTMEYGDIWQAHGMSRETWQERTTSAAEGFGDWPVPERPHFVVGTFTETHDPLESAWPARDWTREEFVAAYPQSYLADPINAPEIAYVRTRAGSAASSALVELELPAVQQISSEAEPVSWSNCLYRDLRTGGYIFQVHYRATRTSGGGPKMHFSDVLIGNESGVVRLADVLNEWIRLGSTMGSYPFSRVFVDHPVLGTSVALL